jgi:AcrR family transcriptional regulator
MSPRSAKAIRGRSGNDPVAALREHLLDTAEGLLGEQSISTITTRGIAQAAEVSVGVLYNYFDDKNALLLAALVRRYARTIGVLNAQLPVPGSGDVAQNLIGYGRAALNAVLEVLPTAAGLMSEPALLHRFLVEIHTEPYGPHMFQRPLAEYLRGEQAIGRIGDIDLNAALTILTGSVIVIGLSGMAGGQSSTSLSDQLPIVVHTLLRGLNPL